MSGVYTRWTPVRKFPITSTLRKLIPKGKCSANKPQFISEGLCDDIVQRLSPYLSRNAPVDILDLWPGPGIFSRKINDFLKPRRHVIVEPDLAIYRTLLDPLAASNSSYNLYDKQIAGLRDWKSLLELLPEQGPSSSDNSGALPKNDSLLVIAHPPGPRSVRDHFSVARWLSVFMEECLRGDGLHAYGSVRLLLSMSTDIASVLPRQISSRGRPAFLTEQVALHAFEVASTMEETRHTWALAKQWKTLSDGLARVEQRTSENNVPIPAGRKYPPIEMAPDTSHVGRNPLPYTPRIKSPHHPKHLAAVEDADKADPKSPDYEELQKLRRRTLAKLKQENVEYFGRAKLSSIQNKIDDLNKSISRLAAEPTTTLAALEPVVKGVETLQESLSKELSKTHYDITRMLPHLKDDRRAAGNIDDALLLFDRRPFEPLLIEPNEVYPREVHKTLMYFEADPNSPTRIRLNRLNHEERDRAVRFFTAWSSSIQTNNLLTVSKLIELFFIGRSANDMVKAIPSLATHAFKRPKPNFDTLPKTLHPNWDDPRANSNPDPVSCYQENLNYDLSDVRCRTLPPATIWDISTEYARLGIDQDPVQMNRLLGGTMTTAQTRETLREKIKKRW
ncbi:uncharacterized protein BDV17DRAFT_138639 [Aspergillus undulatus]|uniref:uncharacterized protein n=1 Tax=Aspergillus undulatus TaxID=1810928 RepID=UPI003CCCDE7D